MYARDYCYIRRAIVDRKNNLMVLVSRATDHPKCPEGKKNVRVKQYESKMVIRPHKSFDENGFDYLLTYFDDPKSSFPSIAYNWMAASGVPEFVKQLHSAAYTLTTRNANFYAKAKRSREMSNSSKAEAKSSTPTDAKPIPPNTKMPPSSPSNPTTNPNQSTPPTQPAPQTTTQSSTMNYGYA